MNTGAHKPIRLPTNSGLEPINGYPVGLREVVADALAEALAQGQGQDTPPAPAPATRSKGTWFMVVMAVLLLASEVLSHARANWGSTSAPSLAAADQKELQELREARKAHEADQALQRHLQLKGLIEVNGHGIQANREALEKLSKSNNNAWRVLDRLTPDAVAGATE